MIAQRSHFTVHDQPLQIHVGGTQACESRSLVAATRLESNVPVLHNVYATYAVLPRNGVASQEQVHRVCHSVLAAIVIIYQFLGETLLEVEREVLRVVWGFPRVLGELPHILRGRGVRIFQYTGLVRAVCQVLCKSVSVPCYAQTWPKSAQLTIHAPWLRLCA